MYIILVDPTLIATKRCVVSTVLFRSNLSHEIKMSDWYDIVTENTKHQPDVSVGQFGSLRPQHLHIWASKGLWARSLTVVTALVSSLLPLLALSLL